MFKSSKPSIIAEGEFKNGQVIAFGNYKQLLKDSKTFFDMVEIAKRTHKMNI